MTTEQYIEALKKHDWFYEFSDDHSVYQRGRAAFMQLLQAQKKLDPKYETWNQYAPKEYRR